jgi:hypothetical protein
VRKEQGIPVVILFLLLYVLFTALELASLIPKVRRKSPAQQ